MLWLQTTLPFPQPKPGPLPKDRSETTMPLQVTDTDYVSPWSNGLVVKVLDSESRGPVLKTIEWFQSRLSFSSFRGQLNEYQEFVGT